MADEMVFRGSSLDELARDMRRAARVVRRETDKTVAAVGVEIAAEARKLAGEHSKVIAPTIKLAVAPGAAVIRARDSDTPIAALYEVGNRGGRRTSRTFRHPVFGNRDVWVDQPRYRFLAPAVAVDRRATTRRMEAAWDAALVAAHIRPD